MEIIIITIIVTIYITNLILILILLHTTVAIPPWVTVSLHSYSLFLLKIIPLVPLAWAPRLCSPSSRAPQAWIEDGKGTLVSGLCGVTGETHRVWKVLICSALGPLCRVILQMPGIYVSAAAIPVTTTAATMLILILLLVPLPPLLLLLLLLLIIITITIIILL